MFGLQAKLIIAAVLVASIGALFVHDRWMSKRYEHQKAENATLTATLNAERENVRKANEASAAYQANLKRLAAARADTPTRVVRLCRDTDVPESGPAAGTDGAGGPGVPQAAGRPLTAGPDIGRDLYELADEADRCAVQLEALQRWVRGR